MTVFKGGRKSSTGHRTGLGASFGGLVDYLEHGPRANPNPERVEWSATRNLDTDQPAEAAQLMQFAASENPKVRLPVYHFGLSLDEGGEHLSREQWEESARRVLEHMGLGDHQAVLIAHNDTDSEHVHIVVNRIGDDGRAWRPYRDMKKAREPIPGLELEYGLRRTGREQAPPDLSAGAVREAMRTGVQPLADRVREEAGQVFARATGWRELEAGLAELGYRLERAERGSGLVVTDGSRRASLSHVDRNLSGPKLAARFGETFREHREKNPEPPQVRLRAGGRELEPLPGATPHERTQALLLRVTSTRATFTRADVERAAFHEPESRALARRALERDELVDLGKDARGVTHYTSREYLEAEGRLFRAAGELAGRQELRLDSSAVGRALDRAPHLSAEQRAAVVHATGGDDLAQIVGRAGAGKTTAARTIAEAYREAGYEVRGAALAGKAAEGLQKEAGIPAQTLHSLEYQWGRGEGRLDGGSVLLIDEAGMVDTRQLGQVLSHASGQGAKVILLGDPEQLKPIGAGDAYRGLLEQHGSAALETIRRQAEPWQREASEDLARGRVSTALDAYHQAGDLKLSDTRQTARAELLEQYTADRRSAPDASRLVIAYRNEEVRQLNADLRGARRAAGELAPGVAVGGAEYSAGDRIVFLRNDHQGREVTPLGRAIGGGAGVKNGTLATLESAAPDRFVARLDDGRQVAWNPAQYDKIAHGYAVTIHKSQGATVDRTYVLADPMMNRNASYVALTRHREGVKVYADRETFATREDLDQALSRASRKDLARDYGAAAIERSAARLAPLREQARQLRTDEQTLRSARAAVEHAAVATRHVAERQADLEHAAARVYVNPAQAARAIAADPHAAERLDAATRWAAHQSRGSSARVHELAAAYGQPRGQLRTFRGPDAERMEALNSLSGLQRAARSFGEATRTAADAHERVASWTEVLGKAGVALSDLPRALQRVAAALQRVQHAMKGPEQALETAVRSMGHSAARAAVGMLPPALHAPAQLALHAVEKALDLGLGLGR